MSFHPSGLIYLIGGVRIDNNYSHTLSFDNLADQITYFTHIDRVRYADTDYSFIRKDQKIQVKHSYEDLWDVNYVLYQNESGKWIFSFITDKLYKNDNMTELVIETDLMQTFAFDYNLNYSHVEREHVSNDSIGTHTLEENVDIGEVVIKDNTDITDLNTLAYVFVAAEFPDTPSAAIPVNVYSGVFSGLWMFSSTNITQVGEWLAYFNQEGKEAALSTIFTMPANLIDVYATGLVMGSNYGKSFVERIDKNHSGLDGYFPKNNKMYVYPYNYIEATNNQGQNAIFRYENFSGSDCPFIFTGNVAPSPVVFLEPQEYKNSPIDSGEFLTLSDFPLAPWISDTYSNWLAQNQVSNAMKIGGSLLAIAGGAFTGNLAVAGGGLAGLVSSMGEFKEMSVQPNTAKGSASGGGNVARFKQNFSFMRKTIKAEYARVIDDYFQVYGYKTNDFKVPNTDSRKYYNYIKCHQANLTGDIDMLDLVRLKDIYENGVTIWHKVAGEELNIISDYSKTNSIV